MELRDHTEMRVDVRTYRDNLNAHAARAFLHHLRTDALPHWDPGDNVHITLEIDGLRADFTAGDSTTYNEVWMYWPAAALPKRGAELHIWTDTDEPDQAPPDRTLYLA